MMNGHPSSSSGPVPSVQTQVAYYLSHSSTRWLKPFELQTILEHFKSNHFHWQISGIPISLLSTTIPQRPKPGSVYLYSRSQILHWKQQDGYIWKGGETHTDLKVGGVVLLVGYYSKCSEGSSSADDSYLDPAGSFQRRAYSFKLPEHPTDSNKAIDTDTFLVHYLDGQKVSSTLKQEEDDEGCDGQNGSGTKKARRSFSSNPLASSSGAIDITKYISYFMPNEQELSVLKTKSKSSKSTRAKSSLTPSQPTQPAPPPFSTTAGSIQPFRAQTQYSLPNEFNCEEFMKLATFPNPLSTITSLSSLLLPNPFGLPPFPLQQPTSLQQTDSFKSISPCPTKLTILDYSPNSDTVDGGAKFLICLDATSTAGSTSPSPIFFLHFLRSGCLSGVSVLPLDRLAENTYRTTIPALILPDEYSLYVSDSPQLTQSTRLSSLIPFQIRPRGANDPLPPSLPPPQFSTTLAPPPPSTVSSGGGLGVPHNFSRTPSRDFKRRSGSPSSRSPAASPVPPSSSRTKRVGPTNAAATAPTSSSSTLETDILETASLEREFIIALIQRVQLLAHAVQASVNTANSSHRSLASPTDFLVNDVSPNQPLSSTKQSSVYQAADSTMNGSSVASVSSISLQDLESCIVDAPGEDLIESLLLSFMKKVMDLDARKGEVLVKHEDHHDQSRPCSQSLITAAQERDHHGRQLIHYVAGLGYTNLLSILITHLSANVNSQDSSGRTPLHYATLADGANGDEFDLTASSPAGMMVSALLSFGADDSLVDARGLTPMALADSTGRMHIVQVFLDVHNAETIGQDHERSVLTNGHSQHRSSNNQDTESDADGEEDELMMDEERPHTLSMTSSSMATSAAAASSSTSSNTGGAFPLDRAFSSLTLHEMGINAQDFLFAPSDGSPGSGSTSSNPMSASELFSSPTSQFSRIVSAIQRQIRWWLFRRHMAAKKLQSLARGMLARKSMKRMREASVILQNKFRQRKVRREFVKLQKVTRFIQEKFRDKHVMAGASSSVNGGVHDSHLTHHHSDPDPDQLLASESESDSMTARRRHLMNKRTISDDESSAQQLSEEPFQFSSPMDQTIEQQPYSNTLNYHPNQVLSQQHQQASSSSGLDFNFSSPIHRESVVSPDPLSQQLLMFQDASNSEFQPLVFDALEQDGPNRPSSPLLQSSSQTDSMMMT